MTIPTEQQIQIPLLEEIAKVCGTARAKDLYLPVAAHFPQITEEDLRRKLPSGKEYEWRNKVQWARQQLVWKGELEPHVRGRRGTWSITEAGRRRLEANGKDVGCQPEPTITQDPAPPRRSFKHDEIARAMENIGKVFGFETKWKPKVNDLRPDRRPIKERRKTLDVAWKIAKLNWVPIEVQVGGSVPDLIFRFQQVHQWSLRLVVVTVSDFADEIREATREYPFRDKIVVLDPGEVFAATQSLDRLLELKEKIFE